MPFTIVSPAVPSSNIKIKWREQYTTSGINKKFAGIIPPGIYRGLSLSTSGSDNSVTVVPDATNEDHLAVYETADGFSLTFKDSSNSTYTIDLSDVSLLSQTLVIAMFLDYQEGVDTTGSFIIYTVAEYDALSAALRGELLVLGTVVNPGATTSIGSSSISNTRRTVAVFNQALLAWRPLISNSSFERSPTNRTATGHEVEGWTSSGSWKASNTGVNSGNRCMEFNVSGAGTYSETLRHRIGAGVLPGQHILIKLVKKVVAAASSGTASITAGFTGDDGGSASELTFNFTITSTDAAYESTDIYFVVPSGKTMLAYIGVKTTSAVYAGSGAKFRIDNLSALLEPVTVDDALAFNDDRQRERSVTALVVEDPASTSYGDKAAGFSFVSSAPTGEGALRLARKDLDYTSTNMPPALQLDGRILSLGDKLLGTEANALKARIAASSSVAASTEYTLMFESGRDGETTGTYTYGAYRLYVGAHGDQVFTFNAKFGGTTWTKDVTGADAWMTVTGVAGFATATRVSDAAWVDAAWSQNLLNTSTGTSLGDDQGLTLSGTGGISVDDGDVELATGDLTLGTGNLEVSDGNVTVVGAVDITGEVAVTGDITLSGTHKYNHGTRFKWFGVHSYSVISSTDTVGHTNGVPGVVQAASSTAYYTVPELSNYERLVAIVLTTTGGAGASFTLVAYDDFDPTYGNITGATGISIVADQVSLVPTPPVDTAYATRVYAIKCVTAGATATIKVGIMTYDAPAS